MGLVILLLIVVPVVELYVMVQVAHAFGFWEMLAALVLASLAGVWVMRYAGFRAWRRMTRAGIAGEPIGREAANSALVFLAGVLLFVPGFVTAALGLLLLLPPVRALVRNRFQRRFASATRRGRVITATYDRTNGWRGPNDRPPGPPRGELE